MEKYLAVKQTVEVKPKDITDFLPQVSKWLEKKGYKKSSNNFGEYVYQKGILTIYPETNITNGGIRFWIGRHDYVSTNGKCLVTANNHFGEFDTFENVIAEYEKGYVQALADIKEFYNEFYKEEK